MFNQLRSKISPENWLILALFTAGLLVRTYHLGVPSFCDDEISTTRRINHSLIDTMLLLRYTAFPPLHYAILNLWVRIAGSGEWALRFPSALFSSLTVIVIYKIGRELFNKTAALIAALLLVFSPFAVNYAQNAKMYALYWFLTSVSFLFLFRFLKGSAKNSLRSYVLVSVLCCYTMLTGFLFLAVQSMMVVLWAERRRWKKWLAGQLVILCLCAPWVIYFYCSPHEVFCLRAPDEAFNYLMFFSDSLLRVLGNYNGSHRGFDLFLYVFLLTYALVNRGANDRYLWAWLAAPVIIYLGIDAIWVHAQLAERYIGFLQIPLVLLVSSQISRLKGAVKLVLALTVILLAVSSTYVYFKDNLRMPEQDWRLIAGDLTQHLGKDDIVLSMVGLTMIEYYYRSDMHRFFEIPANEFSPEILEQKRIPRGVHAVFVIYERRGPPDVQLNGFFMDYRMAHGASGILHFRRI